MASVNKVFLMGNLTRDPEIRYLTSGTPVATFGLAVNKKYKSGEEWKEEVCFVDISVFGKQAEACSTYLQKGSQAFIEGELHFSSWEKEGQKKSKLDVRATNVQFLGGKGKGEGQADDQPDDDLPDWAKDNNAKYAKKSAAPAEPGIDDLVDDDIPF